MATERKLEIILSASDDYSAALAKFNTALSSTSTSAETAGTKMSDGFGNIKTSIAGISSAWVAVAGVVASSAWLISATKDALDAEESFNRLRIQITATGADYKSIAPAIEAATTATSKYALVQDEDVATALQQMILHSGNLQKSLENLNLVYDLAYLKNIDQAEAATLVGKAIAGNIEGLRRLFPELKNIEDVLGKNATQADKAAFALAFFNEKVGAGVGEMTEHAKTLARLDLAYQGFKQTIGEVSLALVGTFFQALDTAAQMEFGLGEAHEKTAAIVTKTAAEIAAASKLLSDRKDAEKRKTEEATRATKDYADAMARVEDVITGIDQAIAKLTGDETALLTIEVQRLVTMGATTEQLTKYLEKLKEQNKLEEEAAAKKSAPKEKVSTVQADAHIAAYEAELKFQALMVDSYSGYFSQLSEMHREYGDEVTAQYLKTAQGQLYVAENTFGMMADMMQNLTTIAGEEGGAAFEAMKVFAIAETIINTYRAAQNAYAALAGIPVVGPALGVAAAAAAIVAGMARVKAITDTEPGSSTTISSTGEATTDYTGGSTDTSTPTDTSTTEAVQTQSITVIVNNPLSSDNWQKIVEDNIVPALNDAIDRNITLNIKAA